MPPEKFIGREREIDVILDRLANPYNRGGSMVSGPSGIGKTSLLHYLLVEDTRKQWGMLGSEVARFIYIPTNLITPFSEFGFWEHLFYKLADWLEVTPGTEKVVKSLEAGKSPTRVDISRFFDKLGESKEKKFVVVLLDGFDRLMGEINKDNSQAGLGFLHTLRALLNLPAPRSFSLITSSERELFDLFANVPWFGSGFYSNLANLPLGPFSDIQIDDLIVSYLRNTGVNFDDRERNHLKRASSGHPQTLQRTAFELFEIKVASIGSIKAEKGEKKMAFDATLINIISSASTLLIDIARDVFKGRQAKRQDTQTSIEADTTTLATLPLDQPNELKTFLQQINLANQKTKIDMIESLANQLTRHKRNWNDYSEEEAKPTASAAARVEARQLREDEEVLIKRKSLMLKQQLEELTGRPIELSGLE
ncbi:MAG: ATP-binding protein [Anaerolineales bacterium]|nr:ATP-binding protein [Anaerolineales bacterium]